MHPTQVPEYSFPARSNKKKRSESLEDMNDTNRPTSSAQPNSTAVPKTQDLQQYLQSHAVEPILTSLLEHICFYRPENVPQAMIQFLQSKYPISLPSRTFTVNKSVYSLTVEQPSANSNAKPPVAAQRPNSAQSTSSKDSEESTQDKKSPFSWLQRGSGGSPVPGPNDSFYTFGLILFDTSSKTLFDYFFKQITKQAKLIFMNLKIVGEDTLSLYH